MANISSIKLPDGNTYDLVDKISGPDVFIGEYNVTTYAEVSTAVNAGKEVIITYNGDWFRYIRTDNTSHYFIRLRGSVNIPQLFVLAVSGSNVWEYNYTTLGTFPVGSRYITSTNTNPKTWLGGEWSLIHKNWANASGTNGISWNNTNTQNQSGGSNTRTFQWVRKSDYLYLRFTWYTKVAPSDSDITIATITGSTLGLTSTGSGWPIYQCGVSDGSNAIPLCYLGWENGTATLTINDWVTRATSYPTTTNVGASVQMISIHDDASKADSACDEFIWERTS